MTSSAALDRDVQNVPAGAIERVGARMVILDPADRVLLIEERGGTGSARWHHWLTPGGGVEGDEQLRAAATREVIEETGLRIELAPTAPAVYRQRRLWQWGTSTYIQLDTLFGARVAAPFDVAPAALTEMEQQTVVGSRWWTVGELRASSDTVIPPDLADVVERLVATDAVSRPVRRRAGRMLVIDRDGCVLLIKSRQAPHSSTLNWVAPGGGVEQGETTAQAAVRELFEETGIVATVAADAEPVSSERAVFLVGDWHLDQTDDYYVWRVDDRPRPDRSRLTAVEQATVLDYAWWSAPELSAGTERYWPADLPSVLSRLAG